MPFKSLIIAIGMLFSPNILLGQGSEWVPQTTPSLEKELMIGFENDIFTKTDHYFTNGITLNYSDYRLKVHWLDNLLVTPGYYPQEKTSIQVVQNMYTPLEIDTNILNKHDRPYAGALIFSYINQTYNKRVRITSKLSLGSLGKFSFTQQTQNFVHQFNDMHPAQGWQYQVNNAPIINLGYQMDYLLSSNKLHDFTSTASVRLGSLETGFRFNSQVRIGIRSNMFSYLGPKAYSTEHDFELYAYLKGGVNIPIYNATLQGGITSKAPSQHVIDEHKMESVVYETHLGLAVGYKRFYMNLGIIHISPEFKGGLEHSWGSVAIKFSF